MTFTEYVLMYVQLHYDPCIMVQYANTDVVNMAHLCFFCLECWLLVAKKKEIQRAL